MCFAVFRFIRIFVGAVGGIGLESGLGREIVIKGKRWNFIRVGIDGIVIEDPSSLVARKCRQNIVDKVLDEKNFRYPRLNKSYEQIICNFR